MNNNGQTKQVTRPYVYHAIGNQKLKNFAGQCLANELENMVMHKWKVAAEAIPEKYLEAYINPQKASVLVYNAFQEGSQGTIPLPHHKRLDVLVRRLKLFRLLRVRIVRCNPFWDPMMHPLALTTIN